MNRNEDKITLTNEDFMTLVPEHRRPYFETPLQNTKAGIQIRGLSKVRSTINQQNDTCRPISFYVR